MKVISFNIFQNRGNMLEVGYETEMQKGELHQS